MGHLLVVDPTPAERAVLLRTPGADMRVVATTGLDAELRNAVDSVDSVDAVVVGTAAASPVRVAQRVHRSVVHAGVIVLTSPEREQEIRRATRYAPDLPASLVVTSGDRPDLSDLVGAALENAVAQRRHQQLLEAVTAHHHTTAAPRISSASLGALLAHAPFGVLVGALDGRVVSWNRAAEDLLELSTNAGPQHIPGLFPDPGPLAALFELARGGRLSGAAPIQVTEGPAGTDVEVTAVPTQFDDGQNAVLVLLLDVTARRSAERTRDRLQAHVGLLARVSEMLSATLDTEKALQLLAYQLVPVLADWVTVQTFDERRRPHLAAVHHRDPELRELASQVESLLPPALSEDAPSRRVARGEGPVLLKRMPEELMRRLVQDEHAMRTVERLGVGSLLVVPMPGRDRVLGALALVNTPESPAFSDEDLAVAVEVGRRAGVALETARLYAAQRELAEQLQRSMLTEPPRWGHGRIAVRYVTAAQAAQVGGDWYDAYLQGDGAVVLTIGDVMGHDTRAAAAMGQLRSLLRGIGYTTGTGPAENLTRLDAAIDGLRLDTTASALVARVAPSPTEGGGISVCWSSAGHPPPVTVSPTGAVTVHEAADPDPLLGVDPRTPRGETRLQLPRGTVLLLFTDGLVERRSRSIDAGLKALTHALGSIGPAPLDALCDRLLARLVPDEPDDDVALLALRIDGEPVPADAAEGAVRPTSLGARASSPPCAAPASG